MMVYAGAPSVLAWGWEDGHGPTSPASTAWVRWRSGHVVVIILCPLVCSPTTLLESAPHK